MNQTWRVRSLLLATISTVTLAFLTAALADDKPKPKAPAPDFSKPQLVKVVRVIDGDTIEVEGGEKVRLVGVDTPETAHPSKPVERFGKEASDFTRKALVGEKVFLVLDSNSAGTKHRDRYGRLLAYVWRERDKLDFCAELVRQGFAFAYLKYPSDRGEEFLVYQREARDAKRGLWGDDGAIAAAKEKPAGVTGEVNVYVTASGKKYHQAGCPHLAKSMRELTLAEAVKRYEPCSVCKPPVRRTDP
jgi:micrococcal nuclease